MIAILCDGENCQEKILPIESTIELNEQKDFTETRIDTRFLIYGDWHFARKKQYCPKCNSKIDNGEEHF